jgi:lysozyme
MDFQDKILSDSQLKKQIRDHEGFSSYAYQDSLGYLTIGIGRLIDKNKHGGISGDEAFYLLNNDLKTSINELSIYTWFLNQDLVRQGVLVELHFNMGLPNLLEFHHMLDAFSNKDYPLAAQSLRDSKWSSEVKQKRTDDICYRIIHGDYP